ncbi:hypothetical protein F5Y17DRAFT_120142 [Xylariaceae sp. FL0594]|nr:hypothetical protein F5Y17DRAFT_120142 [Xylariaceae sp. FL0594]
MRMKTLARLFCTGHIFTYVYLQSQPTLSHHYEFGREGVLRAQVRNRLPILRSLTSEIMSMLVALCHASCKPIPRPRSPQHVGIDVSDGRTVPPSGTNELAETWCEEYKRRLESTECGIFPCGHNFVQDLRGTSTNYRTSPSLLFPITLQQIDIT